MKKLYINFLAFFFIAILALPFAAKADDPVYLTCTGSGNFTKLFKLTLSKTIKIRWSVDSADEPRHMGSDSVTEEHINSCIEDGEKVKCINLNRVTGKFLYTHVRPIWEESDLPKIISYYDKDIVQKSEGSCVVGKAKAF